MAVRKINLDKAIKYIVFGGVTASLEFAIFLLLSPWTHIYVASTASFMVGLVASFIFNKFMVFKNSKDIDKSEVFQFATLGLVNSQLSSLMTWAISMILPGYVAKILSIGAIVVWNFLLMNFVIFKRK